MDKDLQQGPDCGRIHPPEAVVSTDPDSGAKVTRLTSWRCHSLHLYFTHSGWWDGDRQLLVPSERHNQPNLFSVDLASHELTQLTDFGEAPDLPMQRRSGGQDLMLRNGCRHPTRERFYFSAHGTVWSVALRGGELQRLWAWPEGWSRGIMGCTCDGRYLCMAVKKKLRDCWPDWCDGYLSRIYRLDLASGKAEIVHEDEACINHVNPSPTQPHLLTFCHEGAPWRLTSRIWGLDLTDQRAWPIRPLTEAEAVNHEWWHADGVHVGFMVGRGDNYRTPSVGWIHHDNSGHVEHETGVHCTHYQGHDPSLIVGDGSAREPYLCAWSWRDGQWRGPKVVCRHGSSFSCQPVHPHPRVSPDGSYVILTSDATTYGNVYRIDLPAFDDLPDWPPPPRPPN